MQEPIHAVMQSNELNSKNDNTYTKPQKTFCQHGEVDKTKHYYIAPTKWIKEKVLCDLIQRRNWINFISPKQSGKTTMIRELVEHLNCYKIVYVDMHNIFTFNQLAQEVLEQLHAMNICMFADMQNTRYNFWIFLFQKHIAKPSIPEGIEVLLILDGFDNIRNNKNASEILDGLRCMREDFHRTPHALTCVALSTRYVYHHEINKDKTKSPFYFSESMIVPYWSLDEVKELINAFAEDANVSISDLVATSIFEKTDGAQGLTTIYAHELARFTDEQKQCPTIAAWRNHINTPEFYEKLIDFADHKDIVDLLDNYDVLCDLFYGLISHDILADNRLIRNYEYWASPLIVEIIREHFASRFEFPKSQVPIYKNKVDFLLLMNEVVSNMMPFDFFKQKTQGSNKSYFDWNVEVYKNAVRAALKRCLPDARM
jgi:hypothetical protein